MPQCHHVGAGFARPKCIPIDFYNRMEMIWHNNIFATFDIGVFVFQIPTVPTWGTFLISPNKCLWFWVHIVMKYNPSCE